MLNTNRTLNIIQIYDCYCYSPAIKLVTAPEHKALHLHFQFTCRKTSCTLDSHAHDLYMTRYYKPKYSIFKN